MRGKKERRSLNKKQTIKTRSTCALYKYDTV